MPMQIASIAQTSARRSEGRKRTKMIRKVIYVIAVVVIAIGVVNDVGRYVVATFQLSDVTQGAAGAGCG